MIPIQDYLVPTFFAVQFGQAQMLDWLDDESLAFVRAIPGFGYAAPRAAGSKTGGFLTFVHPAHTRAGGQRPPSTEEMVDRALAALRTAVAGPVEPRLRQLLIERTTQIDLDGDIARLGDLTLSQLRQEEALRAYSGVRVVNGALVLPGAQPSVTVFSGVLGAHSDTPESRMSRLLSLNVEMWLTAMTGADDIHTTTPIERLLTSRAIGSRRGSASVSAFGTLRSLADIPDVGQLAFDDQGSLRKLMRLRRSRAAASFRKWFHADAIAQDDDTVAKAYVDLLRTEDPWANTSVKTVRFLLTAALGRVPVVGELAAFFDGVVLERLLARGTAKFFVDELAAFHRPSEGSVGEEDGAFGLAESGEIPDNPHR